MREGISSRAVNDEKWGELDSVHEGTQVPAVSEQAPRPVMEDDAGRQAAIRHTKEQLTARNHQGERAAAEAREERATRIQETVAGEKNPEAERMLRELEESIGERPWDINGFGNLGREQRIGIDLNQKDFQEQDLRKKVSGGLLFGGALSAAGGMGAAALGLAEASAAVTAGMLGTAAFAGGLIVLPPAFYAWHKLKQWRRNRQYERIFGKPPPNQKSRSIWGF